MAGNHVNNLHESSLAALENYVKDHKFLIDTCSLIGNGDGREDLFLDNIIPLLKKYDNQIIVPVKVVDEIEKHINKPKREGLDKLASLAYGRLYRLQTEDCLSLNGETTDTYADQVFQYVATKFRSAYKIILITDDRKLITYFENLNKDHSVRANAVKCMGINRHGFLSHKEGLPINGSGSRTGSYSKTGSKYSLGSQYSRSILASSLTNIKDEAMDVSFIPESGDTVHTTDGKEISLGDRIAAGGEGILYDVDDNNVAKIYKRENNTTRKYEKIRLMISKGLRYPGICFPSQMLFNSDNQFVGYVMPKAKGKDLQRCVFLKPLLLKNFPNWKKRDTVELSLTILSKIRYLHNHGVIMGDINPNNIMVVSTTEVYFVDTDSYQIDGFPCPVGTCNFTAPEIQRKHFGDFLRTFGNENFAVATLLFMIMLPGKAPYSQQGGADPITNIMNGDFSYPLGDNYNKKAPEGAWRFIWSHLTYRAKEAFHETFSKNGKYYSENNRLSVNDWISIFKEYLGLLDSGKFSDRDPMSAELFPSRFKNVGKNGSSKPVTGTSSKNTNTNSTPQKKKQGILAKFRSIF